MTAHVHFPGADGTAALGICESLLLALTDSKIISDAVATAESPEKHHAVIAIVQRILAGKNGVRH